MDCNFDTCSLANLSEATIWSNCTNVSFSAFLDGFNAKKELHLAMLSILATVRDAIQQENGTETDTEYYSGLILTLANVDSDKKLTATMALLQMVLKRVPPAVLQHTFSDTTSILLLILEKTKTSSYGAYLTKLIIKSFETLLMNQDFNCWQESSTQKIFQVILQFIISDQAKIRKSAKCAVISMIHCNEKFGSNSIPARLTAEFCIQKLEEYLATTTDEHFKIVTYVFNLLSNALAFFPTVTHTKDVCEAILSYVGLGNSVLCSLAMQTFYSFFLLKPKSTVLTPELNARLLNAFYDYQPNINNGDGVIDWTINMKEGLLSLNNLDSNLFYLHVPKFFRICVQYLQNDSSFVHSNISYVIKSIVNSIGNNSDPVPNDLLKKLYTELEATLKYQYSHSWNHIIPMHMEIFDQNKYLQSGYGLIIERMAIIYKSEDDISEFIQDFFVQVIKSRGPRFVLKYCPVEWKTYANSRIEYDNTEDEFENNIKLDCNDLEYKGEFTNSWLIPLLRDNIRKHSELLLFVEHFLPMIDELKKKLLKAQKLLTKLKEKASNCMQVDNEVNQESDLIEFLTIMIKELNRVLHAIWSLLPSFCRCPNDVPQAFSKIAQRIGENLYDKEFCVYSLSALRNILKCDEEIQKKVGLYSKNYLPILFNIYLNENIGKNFHFPILVLINHFVPLLFANDTSDSNSMIIFNTYFNKLLERLNQPNNSIFLKHSLLDIIRAFLKSPKGFNLENIQHIYEEIAKPLIVNKSLPIEQKKGFRFIEDIVDSDSMACKEFVGNNLNNIIEFILVYEDSKYLKSASTKSFIYRILSKILEKYYLNNDNPSGCNGIDWDNMLVNILTLVLNNLTIKSSKTKKNARETLLILSQCFEKMEDNPNATRFLSIIVNLLKNNPDMDSLTKTSCLDAISFLYVKKYHSASNAVVSDIADTILSSLSNSDIIPPTRPILNICFDFIKNFLNNASVDLFDSYLEVITCGITNLPSEHRTKYHMVVKIILTKLCRRFGYDLIRSMVPENYQKVIKNIRKIEEKKKKKSNDNETNASEYDTKSRYSRKSKKRVDVYDDSSSEEENIQNLPKQQKYFEDYEDEKFDDDDDDDENDGADPSDLLTLKSGKSNILNISNKKRNNSVGNENQVPMSKDGRIILTKLFEQLGDTRGKKRSIDETNEDESDDDSDDNIEEKSYKPGGKGIHRPIQSDTKSKISSIRSKTTAKSKSKASTKLSSKGEAYRSKKAFGDMKRKGLPDPYAYYPFDLKSLNKRKKLKHKGEFNSIIKGAKKGAIKGKYLKNKRSKSK